MAASTLGVVINEHDDASSVDDSLDSPVAFSLRQRFSSDGNVDDMVSSPITATLRHHFLSSNRLPPQESLDSPITATLRHHFQSSNRLSPQESLDSPITQTLRQHFESDDRLSPQRGDSEKLAYPDDEVLRHMQVAEEAVSGWERATAESKELKARLGNALHDIQAQEVKCTRLDAALKECMRELRKAREQQSKSSSRTSGLTADSNQENGQIALLAEQDISARVENALVKKQDEWEEVKRGLEAKATEMEHQMQDLMSEMDAMAVVLEDRALIIHDLEIAKVRSEKEREQLALLLEELEQEKCSTADEEDDSHTITAARSHSGDHAGAPSGNEIDGKCPTERKDLGRINLDVGPLEELELECKQLKEMLHAFKTKQAEDRQQQLEAEVKEVKEVADQMDGSALSYQSDSDSGSSLTEASQRDLRTPTAAKQRPRLIPSDRLHVGALNSVDVKAEPQAWLQEKSKLTSALQKRESELQEMTELCEALQRSLRAMQSQLQTMEAEGSTSSGSFQTAASPVALRYATVVLHVRLDTVSSRSKGNVIDQQLNERMGWLQNELCESQQHRARLTMDVSKVQENVTLLDAELSLSNSEKDRMETELSTLSSRNRELLTEVANWKSRTAIIQAELAAVRRGFGPDAGSTEAAQLQNVIGQLAVLEADRTGAQAESAARQVNNVHAAAGQGGKAGATASSLARQEDSEALPSDDSVNSVDICTDNLSTEDICRSHADTTAIASYLSECDHLGNVESGAQSPSAIDVSVASSHELCSRLHGECTAVRAEVEELLSRLEHLQGVKECQIKVQNAVAQELIDAKNRATVLESRLAEETMRTEELHLAALEDNASISHQQNPLAELEAARQTVIELWASKGAYHAELEALRCDKEESEQELVGVKVQLGEMAVCLADATKEITDLSRKAKESEDFARQARENVEVEKAGGYLQHTTPRLSNVVDNDRQIASEDTEKQEQPGALRAEQLSMDVEDLKCQLGACRDDCARLVVELSAMTHAQEEVAARCGRLEQELRAAEDLQDSLRSAVTACQLERDTLGMDLAAITSQAVELASQCQEKQARMQETHLELQSLKDDMHAASFRFAELQAELGNQREVAGHAQQEVDAAQLELAKLRADLAAAKSAGGSAEVSKQELENMLADAMDRLSMAVEELVVVKEQREHLSQQLQGVLANGSMLMAQLNSAKGELDMERATRNFIVGKLQHELQELYARASDDAIANLANVVAEKDAELASASERLEDARATIEALGEQLVALAVPRPTSPPVYGEWGSRSPALHELTASTVQNPLYQESVQHCQDGRASIRMWNGLQVPGPAAAASHGFQCDREPSSPFAQASSTPPPSAAEAGSRPHRYLGAALSPSSTSPGTPTEVTASPADFPSYSSPSHFYSPVSISRPGIGGLSPQLYEQGANAKARLASGPSPGSKESGTPRQGRLAKVTLSGFLARAKRARWMFDSDR
eukprot:SM000076S21746  [mRNA]  locus=s76:67117:73985:- [translate_table: standard]